MKKVGLVLEGGGMRGAYTAGAIAWLIDNDIMFEYGVGISAGAIYLCSYYNKRKQELFDISVKYMSDKKNVGVYPLLHEHRYVGYNYMFDDLLKTQVKYDVKSIRENNVNLEYGIYDLNKCDTLFFGPKDLDDDLIMLKASCSLPIAGNIVDYKGYRFLDGGIKIMVPIQRSIDKGYTKNFVITTKPEGYVRKAAGSFMRHLMKFNYKKYPKMVFDYTNRHTSYNQQMALVESEIEKGNCMMMRPSESIPVKRFSGDPENLEKLYHLGYSDMENNKEKILKFINE